MKRLFCSTCGVWVPVTKQYLAKAAGAAIGLRARNPWAFVVALLVGHLVDEAVANVCPSCRHSLG